MNLSDYSVFGSIRPQQMQNPLRYTIFSTEWGYFGLLAGHAGIIRSRLPARYPSQTKAALLAGMPNAQLEPSLFAELQKLIKAYYTGKIVQFPKDIPLSLQDLPRFTKSVLNACRKVAFAGTISYGKLAAKAGNQNAARAVGRIMARNPIPLIIPCHRVIGGNGRLCGFSADGGITVKRKMLQLEREAVFA